MAVRVKVAVDVSRKILEVSALANAGFETDTPQILVPENFAAKLGLFPELPTGTRIKEYHTAGGIMRMHFLENICTVWLIQRPEKKVKPAIVISPIENEVILSDGLISTLEIVIEDAWKGIWRIRGGTTLRNSEEPEFW